MFLLACLLTLLVCATVPTTTTTPPRVIGSTTLIIQPRAEGSTSSGDSTMLIIAIVVACVVALCLLLAICVCMRDYDAKHKGKYVVDEHTKPDEIVPELPVFDDYSTNLISDMQPTMVSPHDNRNSSFFREDGDGTMQSSTLSKPDGDLTFGMGQDLDDAASEISMADSFSSSAYPTSVVIDASGGGGGMTPVHDTEPRVGSPQKFHAATLGAPGTAMSTFQQAAQQMDYAPMSSFGHTVEDAGQHGDTMMSSFSSFRPPSPSADVPALSSYNDSSAAPVLVLQNGDDDGRRGTGLFNSSSLAEVQV